MSYHKYTIKKGSPIRVGGKDEVMQREGIAIASQFARKSTGNLFSGRDGKLTDTKKQVKHASDFELITWLIIKD